MNNTKKLERLYCKYLYVEHVLKTSGRGRAKNEDLLSITSETTFGLLLPTVAQ